MELQTHLDAEVLVITLDDGSKNLLDVGAFQAIERTLDEAAEEVRAIVFEGRPGVLTAGLDTSLLTGASREGVRDLLATFGRVWMRVWTEPRPTVLAATGHCLGAGTMLSMACDHAVAAEGDYAWGLIETQLGFELPEFALALARSNLRRDRLEDLLLPGRRVTPVEAVEAGYADELVPVADVADRARAVAHDLKRLPSRAYAGTKRRLRQATAQAVLDGLREDVVSLTADLP